MIGETKRQMTAGVIISYLVIFVQFFVGLLYTPIMLKTLGQGQYGIYSLCTSFMGYFTIMNGGINAAYIRFYVQIKVKDPKKTSDLNGIFLKIFLALAIIAFIGGWLTSMFSPYIFGAKISPEEYDLVRSSFKYLSISSAVQVLNCVFSSVIIAHEKFVVGKTVNLLSAILNPVLTIPFLLKGYSCIIVIQIHLVTALITFAGNLFYSVYKLKIKFSFNEKDSMLLKNIVQFAGFIVLQSLMDQMNWQIDKFILARTQGANEISLYSVGSTFNKYFIMFSGALSGVFIAQINKLQAKSENNKINHLFLRSSRMFAYLIWLFISGYIIFGQSFVDRWAGNEYRDSFYVGLLLMLPVTASLTMALGQDIARAMNKHQLQIVINFVICVINLFVSIPLAIKWGAIGSAFGTFISEICICLVFEPMYYKKILGLDVLALIKNLKKLVIGMIVPAIFGIIVNYMHCIDSDYKSILFLGIIYFAIYFLSMYLIAFDQYEKNMVDSIIKSIRKMIWHQMR